MQTHIHIYIYIYACTSIHIHIYIYTTYIYICMYMVTPPRPTSHIKQRAVMQTSTLIQILTIQKPEKNTQQPTKNKTKILEPTFWETSVLSAGSPQPPKKPKKQKKHQKPKNKQKQLGDLPRTKKNQQKKTIQKTKNGEPRPGPFLVFGCVGCFWFFWFFGSGQVPQFFCFFVFFGLFGFLVRGKSPNFLVFLIFGLPAGNPKNQKNKN